MVFDKAARRALRTAPGAALACLAVSAAHAQSPSLEDLRSLSLEELASVPVTVVQRRQQTLGEAPGSVYVITPEEIRRAGATTLPEALRLAPNLQVAREAGNEWAISARGMNSFETANKLLVLIDTRSVYSSLHAGIFWDEEHVMIEDIDRIEVFSGPAGALWGANAVNGVINVITKSSADTQGVAGRVRYGSLDSAATARLGGRLSQNLTYRVYGSAFRMENTYSAAGRNALDDYDGIFGGVRFDWRSGATTATLHAEAFDDDILGGDVWGGYVRGRVSHTFSGGQTLFVQAYYDQSARVDPFQDDRIEVADVTGQYSFAPIGRHQFIAGAGYRHTADSYILPGPFILSPPQAEQDLWNAFVQDTITFSPQLNLTLGVKLEDSSYSGFEYLPSARLGWTPGPDTLFWAAVSRAVRTPVRVDRDLVWPGLFFGGPDYKSEELIAYEAGYRGQFADRLNLSVSAFLHDYDDLRTTAPLLPAPSFLPAEFRNEMHGQTYGLEVWGDYQLADWWLLRAGAVALEKDYALDPGARDISDPPASGNDPSFEAMLRSRMDVTRDVQFDATLRWVDDLPAPYVPAYAELDLRLAWQATEALELAVVGTNLLHDSHPETSAAGPPNAVRRGVFVDAIWGF